MPEEKKKTVQFPAINTYGTGNRSNASANLTSTQETSDYSRMKTIQEYKAQHILNDIFNFAQNPKKLTIDLIQNYYEIRSISSLNSEFKKEMIVEAIECDHYINLGEFKLASQSIYEYTCQVKNGFLLNGELKIPKTDIDWIMLLLAKCKKKCLVEECEKCRKSKEWEKLYIRLCQYKRFLATYDYGEKGNKDKNSTTDIEKDMIHVKEILKNEFQVHIERRIHNMSPIDQKQLKPWYPKAWLKDPTPEETKKESWKQVRALQFKSNNEKNNRKYSDSMSNDDHNLSENSDSILSLKYNEDGSLYQLEDKSQSDATPPTDIKDISFSRRYSLKSNDQEKSEANTKPFVTNSKPQNASVPTFNLSTTISIKKSEEISRKKQRPSYFKSYQLLDQMFPTTVKDKSNIKEVEDEKEFRATSVNAYTEHRTLSISSSASTMTTTTVVQREKSHIEYIMDRIKFIKEKLIGEKNDYEVALQQCKNILLTLNINEVEKQPNVFVDLYALTASVHQKIGDLTLATTFQRKAADVAKKFNLKNQHAQISLLSDMYMDSGQYMAVLKIWQPLLANPVGDFKNQSLVCERVAECLSRMGKHEDSIKHFLQAMDLASKGVFTHKDRCTFLLKIAEENRKAGNFDTAISFCEESLEIAVKEEDLATQSKILSQLMELQQYIKSSKALDKYM